MRPLLASRPYLDRPRPKQAVTATAALAVLSQAQTDDPALVRPYTTDPALRSARRVLNAARVCATLAALDLLASLSTTQREGDR
ncbi:hypothetical protein [Nocardiopsis synnemataformans]|uniref:hypothetical protein n=1 Tax=Nocardiopsis synnemataformans TaxID=61305 RepID=UPI003EB92EB6